MTILYLDAFLALNFGVNYLLLACAGRLDGSPARSWRYALGAALGTGWGLLSLVPGWGFLEHPVCKALMAVGMLLAAFGWSGRLLRVGGLFLVLSCALSGALLLLALARGATLGPGGILGSSLGVRGILISAALGYGCLSLLLGGAFTHGGPSGELRELKLSHRGRSVTMLALQDTGNTLRDPLTGRPVVVVEGERLRELVPELHLGDRGRLADPVSVLREMEGEGSALGLRLLPYRAVGVDCGLLLALRLDRAEYGGRACRGCLTALSPTPVSEGGAYCALIGGQE